MITIEDTKALVGMGYRHLGKSVWAKPVGFVLFVFRENEFNLSMCFRSIAGDMQVWSDDSYEEDPEHGLLGFLKSFEAYNFQTLGNCWNSKFEFITQEEMFNLSL